MKRRPSMSGAITRTNRASRPSRGTVFLSFTADTAARPLLPDVNKFHCDLTTRAPPFPMTEVRDYRDWNTLNRCRCMFTYTTFVRVCHCNVIVDASINTSYTTGNNIACCNLGALNSSSFVLSGIMFPETWVSLLLVVTIFACHLRAKSRLQAYK